MRLLAYGTLCGGFLSEKWLGKPEPAGNPRLEPFEIQALHRRSRRLASVPGHSGAASEISRKHGVSISNVATRWVLEHEAVAAAIIGARLGESEHRDDNLKVFGFALDTEDHARLDAAFAATKPIPGDCGDEYRKPPYLTASGDLSHHLDAIPSVFKAVPVPGRPESPARVLGQRVGADRGLQPSGTRQGHDPRFRHDGDAWWRPLRRAGRCGGADDLYPRQDRGVDFRAGRLAGRRGAHAHLPEGCREMGAGVARPRPRVRPDHACEYDDPGRWPDRRLRGRNRSRSSGFGGSA